MNTTDAHSVAVIHTLSWQFAYRGIIDEKFLKSIDVQARELNWKKGIESNDPPLIRLVLEEGDQLFAFACGLDNRTQADLPECDGELWAIYAHPAKVRCGFGSGLMKQFGSELKRAGKKRFCVWVLKDNLAARAFYESQGGVLSQVIKETTIGKQVLSEVAYEFEL